MILMVYRGVSLHIGRGDKQADPITSFGGNTYHYHHHPSSTKGSLYKKQNKTFQKKNVILLGITYQSDLGILLSNSPLCDGM